MINSGREWDWMDKLGDRNILDKWFEEFKLKAQKVTGGEFENWYDGLSPIELYFYKRWING